MTRQDEVPFRLVSTSKRSRRQRSDAGVPRAPKASKPASGQQELDWNRGARLAMLDALPLASGDASEGRSTSRVSGATALSVLRAIEAHARTFGHAWASAEYIGNEIKRCDRTVRRAIRYLEALQYLIVKPRSGKTHVCSINWGEISLQTSQNQAGQSLANPGQFDHDPGQFDHDPGQCVRRSVKKRKEATPPPSPKSRRQSSERNSHAGSRGDWEAVVEILSGHLRAWKRALRNVKRSGVDPDHVIAIIRHFERLGDRVSQGDLFFRLENAHPTISPENGWRVEMPKPRAPQKRPRTLVVYQTWKEGLSKGATESEILKVLNQRLEFYGYELEPRGAAG